MKRATVCVVALSVICSANLAAAIVVDGTKDAGYGGALSVQTVQTQFGDAMPPGATNGSELDAAYGRIEGGDLYLMLTGNLEDNFNKLNVFIDSKPGGQNTIDFTNNPLNDSGAGYWAFKYDNFSFDAGFEADYMIILRNGSFEGDRFDVDYAIVGGAVDDYDEFFFAFGMTKEGSAAVGPGPNTGVTMDVAFNNSNAAGVTGGTGAADAAAAQAVTTGVELRIPLSFLGSPAGDIKVSAMINGNNQDYLSNQFLGGLAPPQGNLGSDGMGNFTGDLYGLSLNSFTGNQFFVVPATVPLTGDGNGDGWVDGLDYLIWAGNFGDDPSDPPGAAGGDYNGDGKTDGLDYLAWAGNFGTHSASAVPEPSALVLGLLAAIAIAHVARRRR